MHTDNEERTITRVHADAGGNFIFLSVHIRAIRG
jgi:hypothetical protein